MAFVVMFTYTSYIDSLRFVGTHWGMVAESQSVMGEPEKYECKRIMLLRIL